MGPERFTMLAGAVAGRPLVIVPGDHDRAYCDGERIYTAVDSRDSVVLQAALVAAGSLRPRMVRRLAGRRRLRHRYVTLEALRASRVLDSVIPRPVARRIAETYDGVVPDSAEDSLERAANGKDDIPEAPAWMGTIRPARVIMNAPTLTAALSDEDRETEPQALPEIDEEGEAERTDDEEPFKISTSSSRFMQWLQKNMGMSSTPSPDEDNGGQETAVGARATGRVATDAEAVDGKPDVDLDLEGTAVGRLYPEYDLQEGRYRSDWCAVTEYDPRPPEHEVELKTSADRRLRRELARLGLADERHRRQDDGDSLDISALIDFAVDQRSGLSGDSRVYEQRRRTGHDLGILILLDASGSTGEEVSGERVFDEQRDLAARLAAAFDELGDRVATYGFQSWGRNSVQFLRVKRFDDRYDRAAQRRMAALEPGGFTRLGAAVRHATHLLSNRAGTASTLLVVVGDGLPYDDGYEHRYAREDCRRALEEAVVAGVACACVSVRTSTQPDVIEHVWGNVPHRSLDDPSELATHVTPLFRSALRDAAASRRVISADAGRAVHA